MLISSTICASRPEPSTACLSDLTLALTVSVCSGSSRKQARYLGRDNPAGQTQHQPAVQTVRITAGVRGSPTDAASRPRDSAETSERSPAQPE